MFSGESDGEVPLMGSTEDLGMAWDNCMHVLKFTSKMKIKEPSKKGKTLVLRTMEQLESEAPICLTRRQVLCRMISV